MSAEDEMVSGLGALHARVSTLETGFAKLSSDLAENTTVTKRVDENTKGLVDALANLDGFTKVINAVAKFTKPILALAAGAATLWFSIKGGIGLK